jgi:hypothetical protein
MQIDSDGTFLVGQRERLTVRLKGLIRQYQRGPGIVKEFIQNADDAGATWVHIIMDWRDFRSAVPPDDPTRAVLGPALLIANGSAFSDEDFEAIQRIGESPKRHATAKTGRFGLGFNTAYNVTDYPSLISRDRLLCFDPHEDKVAVSGRAGCGYTLTKLASQHPAWLGSFSGAGLDLDSRTFNGTVFRLPLRDVERAEVSEISNEPFDRAALEQIIEQLKLDGPSMLLFTRHVLDLKIQEIPPDSDGVRTIIEICTVNADEVTRSRSILRSTAELEWGDLMKVLEEGKALKSTHRHEMLVEIGAASSETNWHVRIGFYPDDGHELVRLAKHMDEIDERAVPEVGVAIQLSPRESGGLGVATCDGLFFCGLPLPAQTGLPVHINGCFDLDDSRTRPTASGSTSESGRTRAEWNRLLLCHAVANAYADAVATLPQAVAELSPSAAYELWPRTSATGLIPFPGAVDAICRSLADKPVFRCRAGEGYQRRPLTQLAGLPAEADSVLTDAMVAEGYAIPAPAIPASVIDGAASAAIAIMRITPDLLRQKWRLQTHSDCLLEEAPYPALRRRDWLEASARFLIRDRPDDLFGLPIALLENGKLAAFGLAQGGGRLPAPQNSVNYSRSILIGS